jgi:UDP-N-acetylmuramyl pentapeptide phosphotransferase/UDP-N-acetylglucosamine-1-phosphate transferase
MSGVGSRIAAAFPTATNHRGRTVGVWLGVALVAGVGTLVLVIDAAGWVVAGELAPWRRHLAWMVLGTFGVCAAGFVDDLRPARTRGVVRQLAALRHGRVTSGVVKLAAIVAVSAFVCWLLDARGARFVLGVMVVAGTANVFNLLDVRPGRCLKYFLLAAIPLALVASAREAQTLLIWFAGGSILALVPDLRETAMLGDAGSNALGFAVGLGLFETLEVGGLALALALIVAIHVLSETVTLSRVIDATGPLRWFDRLGRLPDPESSPDPTDP